MVCAYRHVLSGGSLIRLLFKEARVVSNQILTAPQASTETCIGSHFQDGPRAVCWNMSKHGTVWSQVDELVLGGQLTWSTVLVWAHFIFPFDIFKKPFRNLFACSFAWSHICVAARCLTRSFLSVSLYVKWNKVSLFSIYFYLYNLLSIKHSGLSSKPSCTMQNCIWLYSSAMLHFIIVVCGQCFADLDVSMRVASQGSTVSLWSLIFLTTNWV